MARDEGTGSDGGSDGGSGGLGGLTVAELRRRASDRGVPGRSTMNRDELLAALGDRSAERPRASRVAAFARLAEARSRGEMVFLPLHLKGHERRRHVRQTIREDHETRISHGDGETAEKFAKLRTSPFHFFRGTGLLFYRDMAGEDAWLPTVLTLGDVHPGNFGIMPSADDVPIFGVNDFDEAYYAPFTWDLKRGATGFLLGGEAEGGLSRKHARKAARAFLEGYVAATRRYAETASERGEQLRQDNAPKLIRKAIEGALEDRDAWLRRKYHDEKRRGFRADDEHVPVSSRVPEFQAALDAYVRDNGIDVPERAGSMRVKDVCERHGQGTASLGLVRYYLLVEGPAGDGTDDLLLEMKQARRSALTGLVPPSDVVVDGEAERIVHAQGVHLVRGDRFYGAAELDGLSLMVRERSPYRDDVDLDELSPKQWRRYARTCGGALAQAHALSDETGMIDHDVEPEILAAVGPQELFVTDVLAFAEAAAKRVRRDHAHFRADHALGAFDSVDHVYR